MLATRGTFFDVRVTRVNSCSNQNKSTLAIFKKIPKRVFNVEIGTFTPLVFGTKGGMGTESQLLLKNLANKLYLKTGDDYASTMTWLRTRLSFEILRSANMCVGGSRTPFRYNKDTLDDFYLSNFIAHTK